MNYLFNVFIDENGLLELETADLSEKGFQRLRWMLFQTKRVVISTKAGYLGTSLCATIDDSYEPLDVRSSTPR